ncbi:plasmid mobilization protein [Larkinella punicea]|uniref:Plasmid mobilization relaxosome protein MobC n=1 Tax=Larkinella punicea TaxID=2315727 RepID=A0A368JL24_9BACT|nr:plasmid mobilization relaxosome protein MobC [Larkinella punicea]RCR68347.1 plasmid mobilization relaxosome protein MobC [Larkinella punicea]
MARPQKDTDAKRNLTIRVRVTSIEKRQIWQQAADAGYTPSDFMRLKTIASAPLRRVPPPDRETLLKLMAELGKIGSNVNQIAHALNYYKASGQLAGVNSEDITKTIADLDGLTTQVLNLLEHGH